MDNVLLTAGLPVTHPSGTQTMFLCGLEFWAPLHKVSGSFALCMSAMVMDKSRIRMQAPEWDLNCAHEEKCCVLSRFEGQGRCSVVHATR